MWGCQSPDAAPYTGRMRKRWWVLGGLLAALGALFAASALGVGGGVRDNLFARPGKVWIIAHQGGEGLRPSNTMLAFEHAASLGADMIETDLHATKDGQLVTIHDASVNRTTNGRGLVKDLTLAELETLDAGYSWTNDGQTFPFRGKGATIPTLDELLTRFPALPLTLEIKQDEPPIAQKLCEVLRARGAEGRVIVASFKDEALREFRAACPDVLTSMTENEVRPIVLLSLANLGGLATPAGEALQVPVSSGGIPVVTKRLVREAARKNVAVQVWTINDEAEMRRLIDLGVSGVITDRPDLLKRVLQERSAAR